MILSGKEIKNRLNKDIFIEPFNDTQLNPNSYNLRLHHDLLVYDEQLLDLKKENRVQAISIPEEGTCLGNR